MYWFYFTDSCGHRHQVFYQLREYDNVMDLLRDQGYEYWGDCRGRAWCGTCHIMVDQPDDFALPDQEEKNRLSQLSNTLVNSRLACQLFLDPSIHQKEFKFIGDD